MCFPKKLQSKSCWGEEIRGVEGGDKCLPCLERERTILHSTYSLWSLLVLLWPCAYLHLNDKCNHQGNKTFGGSHLVPVVP